MKFRVEAKDFVIFIIFSIILFILCAIGVSNITSITTDGTFAGLNFFPALAPNSIALTLIFFLASLGLIFASVSSYIFSKDGKGLGIKLGDKEEKGYSKWAKEKEIKEDRDVERVLPNDINTTAAGIPLVNNGKEIFVDNGEYHSLVIGATGSGKTQTIIHPMVNLLIKNGESMVVTDPKGEIYKSAGNYLKDMGYQVILLNFRETQKGNSWNPLTLPYEYYQEGNKDKATELLDDVALNILYDQNNKGEPFWEKSAADYFSGLTLGLFEDAKKEEVNLNSINYMSTVGEEKMGAGNFIKEYFKLKGDDSNASTFASGTVNAPNETRGGILSTFKQKIRIFTTRENLSEMLATSDFDMRSIGKQKTAVFIVIHDEKTTYHSLATIFIKQCYESLIDVAQEHGGELPVRTNFLLDEFANMPPLKDVTTMVTAARSRKIRFNFIIQNYAQLKQVYGAEQADTIKGNCGNIVYLISTELAALEEISKMCGEVKSKEKDKTASTPLVTVTDLQKMKMFEVIIMRLRKPPFKTKFTPHFQMDYGINYEKADFPTRQGNSVQLFDLKDFVKTAKKEQLLKSVNEVGEDTEKSFNPFGSSPFDFGQKDSSSKQPFDLDAMMRDIDKKIAELDKEEERQRQAQMSKNSSIKSEPEIDLPKEKEEPKVEVEEISLPEPKIETPVQKEIVEEAFIEKEVAKQPLVEEPIVQETIKPQKNKFAGLFDNVDFETEYQAKQDHFTEPNFNSEDREVKHKTPTPINEEIKPTFEDYKPISEPKVETHIEKEIKEPINQPKPKVDVDSLIFKNEEITDDQFFDDFFNED